MARPEIMIDRLERRHWENAAQIYLEGIASGDATFETSVPSWEAWDRSHLPALRFVARAAEEVLGWAALSPISERCVYEGVAEDSVYVTDRACQRGVGRMLLDQLIAASESARIWTLQAGIFPENHASLRLHRAAGFRVVGIRERIGKHGDVWRDVVLLERRSSTVD